MNSIKNVLLNPLLLGFISGIIAILSYVINAKVRKSNISNLDIFKIFLLGLFLGSSNSMLFNILGDKTNIGEQDIFLGNPDF